MKYLAKAIALALTASVIFACNPPAEPEGGQEKQEEQEEQKVTPAEGSTVYGQVTCNGKGMEGVVVSDGIEVVTTNADGVYQMPSAKRNGLVFITIPSGYEVDSEGVLPQFKKNLTQDASTPERVDFILKEAGDQTNHTMLFFGDMHLANRTNDLVQFATFTKEINNYLTEHPSRKIYAMTLGDMTWDLYWYSNNYMFPNYLRDISAVGDLQIFHSIGNHDHDMRTDIIGTLKGWETVDWDTATKYRQNIAPSNYSVNIGEVHYIAMDNIFCKNTTGHASADRIYEKSFVQEAIEWLKKDLSFVSKETPIVVTMHSPIFSQNTATDYMDDPSAFTDCFSGYQSVTFVTGHSHVLWNATRGDNIREYNSGAVCAAWWWAGKYNRTLNIGQDGSPSGYRIMDVKGKEMTSYFKAVGRDADYQFRTYDRNSICITPASLGITAETNATNFTTALNKYGAYNKQSTANEVLIDIWDYDTRWQIEVTENGKPLTVTRVGAYEPLFLIAYTGPRFKESTSTSWNPFKSNHIFKVTASSATSTLEIKVTDDEGRVYTETMTRPKEFSIAKYK